MAEVRKQLGTGAYRVATVGPGLVQQFCPRGPGELLPGNGECALRRFTEQSAQLLEGRAAQRGSDKRYRVRKSVNHNKHVGFLGCTSFHASLAYSDAGESQKRTKTSLLTPTGRLGERLFCMLSRRGVSTEPDTWRSFHQHRAFCTVYLVLTNERSGCGASLKLHLPPFKASTAARGYSRGSEDAAAMHRSKTAYYDILRVSPSATQSQIKTAYYEQSFIYHPDKNLGSKEATQRFSEISEAYNVLRNISLKRKYDRGILSQSDLQRAEKPSYKDTSSRPTASHHHYHHRARQFSQTGRRPMFDFDAFYQAHYGEQLRRERDLRAKKKQMEEEQRKRVNEYNKQRVLEFTFLVLFAMSGMIFISLTKP